MSFDFFARWPAPPLVLGAIVILGERNRGRLIALVVVSWVLGLVILAILLRVFRLW